jgi:hypothetical protein
MGLDDLAKRLADTSRIGMTAAIAEKLRIKSEDATRGELMAMSDEARGPLGVYLLAIYVVDDTDVFGDGEIYWWSIPVILEKGNKARWSPVLGLPSAAPPHRTGSLEWMTNISLKEPPLLAVIPPDDEIMSCVIRLGVYDDDGKPAEVAAAIGQGYETLAMCKREGLVGAEQITVPVREAIFRALAAQDDDILVDEDLTLRAGASARFNVGFVGSLVNAKARVYYLVKDELRTETVGPVQLHRGQTENVRFTSKLERGGRVGVFSRGADVRSDVFGDLTLETPFVGRVLDDRLVDTLRNGFFLGGTGAAKVVAFYTPP